jgi:AAA15 family ATPase/GTPase
MLHSMYIEKCRRFQELSFKFGKKLTIIAGQNAIGKSSLLGMIGHCSQLSKASCKPLLKPSFRTEFSEIFKFSEKYDLPKEHVFTVNYCDKSFADITDYRTVRSYKNKDRGIRFTPRRKNQDGTSTSRKVQFPTLYLGLSRLYPIGETKDENLKNKKPKFSKEDIEWITQYYKKILSMHADSIIGTQEIEISGSEITKKTYGVVTEQYDHLVNSAGQDNMSQILASVLSFKRLKTAMGEEYPGGVLLIDEIDAVLHPAAQINLVEFLYEQAMELDLQIVATTHSLRLLEYLLKRYEIERYNKHATFYDTEIIYLSLEGSKVCQIEDLTWPKIESNLLLLVAGMRDRSVPAVPLFSEDEIARWFLQHLLPEYESKLKYIEANLSCSQLINLRSQDKKYFRTVLIVLDGDQFNNRAISPYNNIITLPEEGLSPEKVFYDFLDSLKPDDEFWKRYRFKDVDTAFNYQLFKEHPPSAFNGENEVKKLHKWFGTFQDVFEELDLFGYWREQNEQTVLEFRKRFKEAFNSVARYHNVSKV